MKKLITLALSCFILLSANAFAQKVDSLKKKSRTKAKTAIAKVDKKAAAATTTATTAVTKKAADVKEKAADTKVATVADTKVAAVKKTKETKVATTKAVTEGVNKTADKAIGKDAKGRTIYEGPKGGQYTLSESGKKQYIKTANKLKVN
ncbi:hypothetical protein [Mucilaginibacter dorajii]|uniref:PBCV-specific basic adaptor domain-containing protein n=1 Tax=Mucilaginibacter dorajii TaxID=692994 RepID=A0ABP7P6F1_9SPHI|nr:hypothetical protein [Mucilaginibacter dorajii]MCS3734587.1 colicin import membrane protein [Mucilaginibacter dorajii]